MDRGSSAIAIALVAAALTGWQAWTSYAERDTPLQALLLQNQVAEVQELLEGARYSCNSRLCSDGNEKHYFCNDSSLERSFSKTSDAIDQLRLVASTDLMAIVLRAQKIHERHAFGRAEPLDPVMENMFKGKPELIKHEHFKKCEREMDAITNEFRTALGVEQFSTGLLQRIGGLHNREKTQD